MAAEPVATRSENVPSDVERLLRSLPEWFGIEHSLVEYVADSRMAVDREWHRRGVGKALLRAVEFAAEPDLPDRTGHRDGLDSTVAVTGTRISW